MSRPFARRLSHEIFDVREDAPGALAVLTARGIELCDARGAAEARIDAPQGTRTCVQLSRAGDGRFVARPRFGPLLVGRRGGSLDPVHELGEHTTYGGVVTTEDGFVAWSGQQLLVDRTEARATVQLDPFVEALARTSAGGLVVWGSHAVLLVDAEGRERGRVARAGRAAPLVLGDRVVVPSEAGLALLDDGGRALFERPDLELVASPASFADGVACMTQDALHLLDEDLSTRWQTPLPWPGRVAHVVGDRLVLAGPWSTRAAIIVDREGRALYTASLRGDLQDAAAYDGGIALADGADAELLVWTADGERRLAHDFAPRVVRSLAGGLATADADVLYVFRAGEDAPIARPLVPEIADPPLGVAVVIDGVVGRRVSEGRHAYRLATPAGAERRVARGTPHRAAATEPEARAVLEALLSRDFDGSLPDLPEEGPAAIAAGALAEHPPARVASLHARAMFRPRSLTERARALAEFARRAFFAELACALGVSPRVLIASVRARRFPLEGPRSIPGYEYLGRFRASGTLRVCDPCYLTEPKRPLLCTRIDDALEGEWHVYVRPGTGADALYTAELVVAHEAGLDVVAHEPIGMIGVDAALAGVYDADCPKPDLDHHVEEGPFAGRGAHAQSGYGDGVYDALVGRVRGKVAKVRIPFLEDGRMDESVVRTTTQEPPRRYTIRERFAAGERIEHSKFGVGLVVTAGAEKIEVQFPDAERVLIHDKR